ncbi:MAG: iron-sulfur cluster co-chaperone HscB C-terminal domain-containing protein, partial [Phycisphaerales bacterium]
MTTEDPFVLLGLERRFDLDARALRAAWMRRIATAHPDAEGGAAEAARLNAAQRELADPLSRAGLLLRLGGAPATDERELPAGFLVEMMELREAADEAEGDAARREALAADARARRGGGG